MATITYTAVSRCGSGGHTVLDIAYNAAAPQRVTYATDEILKPLSALTQDERETLALLILKVHMAGRTRAQIVAEFANPVVVTI